MKRQQRIFWVSVLLMLSMGCGNEKTPVDYYNQSVSAGNMALNLCQSIENDVQRLSNGWAPSGNTAQTLTLLKPSWEQQLGKLKDLEGNEGASEMVNASAAFLEFALKASQEKKMQQLLGIMAQQKDSKLILNEIEAFKPYIDSLYLKEKGYFDAYDKAVEAYTQKNGLEYLKTP